MGALNVAATPPAAPQVTRVRTRCGSSLVQLPTADPMADPMAVPMADPMVRFPGILI
jgi:hypothetical protein